MRALGLIALAAAGVGFLFYTEKGRAPKGQAAERLQDCYQQFNEMVARRRGVEKMVDRALQEPHPDTAVAQAFEEAVTSA